MVELVAAVVGRQTVTVQRMLRLTPDNGTIATRELHSHRATHEALRTLHVGREVLVKRAIPLSVINQTRILRHDALFETGLVAAKGQRFQCAMGVV